MAERSLLSKGEKNFVASCLRNHQDPINSEFDLSLSDIQAQNDNIRNELWRKEQDENSKKSLKQYSEEVAKERIVSHSKRVLINHCSITPPPLTKKRTGNTEEINHKSNNLFIDYDHANDSDCQDLSESQTHLNESLINELVTPYNLREKLVETGLCYYGMCEKNYAEILLGISEILSNCEQSCGSDLELDIKWTFDEMYTQCFYYSLNSCIFTINGVQMTNVNQLTTKLYKQYRTFVRSLERKAKEKVGEVRTAFNKIVKELHPVSSVDNCDDQCEVLACTEQHNFVHETLRNFIYDRRFSREQIKVMAEASKRDVQIYNTSSKTYSENRVAVTKESLPVALLPVDETECLSDSVTDVATSSLASDENVTCVAQEVLLPIALDAETIVSSGSVVSCSLASEDNATKNCVRIQPKRTATATVVSVSPTVATSGSARKRKSSKTQQYNRKRRNVPELEYVAIQPALLLDDGDGQELDLMRRMETNLEDPMYFARHYSATDDFKNNDKPFDVLNSGLKHYIYPLVLCSSPPEGGFPSDIDEIKKASFAKSSALCRYLNRLCSTVASDLISKANFVVIDGTVYDENHIFVDIVNNDNDEKDDGKRQSAYINLRDPSMVKLRNVVDNLKNLIKFTGAVPVNCFATSGNNKEDYITLIVQLSGASIQHFHFDFNWSDFIPQRTGNAADIGRFSRFQGCAMFFNFGFIEQTVDLQAHNFISNSNQQLCNSAMSLMLMRGDQCHAGSANPEPNSVAKLFMYIRKPKYDADDVYFQPSNSDFDVSSAIALLNSVNGNFGDKECVEMEDEVLLFYGPNCSRYNDDDAFGV